MLQNIEYVKNELQTYLGLTEIDFIREVNENVFFEAIDSDSRKI